MRLTFSLLTAFIAKATSTWLKLFAPHAPKATLGHRLNARSKTMIRRGGIEAAAKYRATRAMPAGTTSTLKKLQRALRIEARR